MPCAARGQVVGAQHLEQARPDQQSGAPDAHQSEGERRQKQVVDPVAGLNAARKVDGGSGDPLNQFEKSQLGHGRVNQTNRNSATTNVGTAKQRIAIMFMLESTRVRCRIAAVMPMPSPRMISIRSRRRPARRCSCPCSAAPGSGAVEVEGAADEQHVLPPQRLLEVHLLAQPGLRPGSHCLPQAIRTGSPGICLSRTNAIRLMPSRVGIAVSARRVIRPNTSYDRFRPSLGLDEPRGGSCRGR